MNTSPRITRALFGALGLLALSGCDFQKLGNQATAPRAVEEVSR